MNNVNNDVKSTVFIDESSIWAMRQPYYHHRRRSSCPRLNAIHPPNPQKLHLWSGISWEGAVPLVLFDNNLTSHGYEIIIDEHLGPFMRNFNGGNGRILQDNAPTHVTDTIFEALIRNNIRWVFIFTIPFVRQCSGLI